MIKREKSKHNNKIRGQESRIRTRKEYRGLRIDFRRLKKNYQINKKTNI